MKGIVLVLCGMIGYLLSRFLPDGPLAIYVPMMISYHLLLAFLVVTTIQDKKVKLSIGSAAFTHFAFFVLLVVFAEMQSYIPYFEIVRFLVPCLALAEEALLFGVKGKRKAGDEAEELTPGTAEDYEEFIHYLRKNDRPFSKPGATIKDEYRSWLAYRSKHQQPATDSWQGSA
ncbi:MAG: hypothetical protein WBE72_06060 [Terracidiphilus sp.]